MGRGTAQIEEQTTAAPRTADGPFSYRTVHDYTNGRCWELARALEELTGWPLVGARSGQWRIWHVAVERPGGDLLDIQGCHHPDDFAARWCGQWGRSGLCYPTSAELLEMGGGSAPSLNNITEAIPLAEQLLRRYAPRP